MRVVERLKARLGDFWYYSLMIFCASRVADALNLFVGLWLVPKYVSPDELGAVMPLASFAAFLAVPLTAFATTFMKEVNALATRREFGRLKSLMRGVFVATALALALAIVASRLLMPLFLERIRLVEGSLGVLIVAYALVSCTAPVYSNALQALKKFGALSLISILGAPLRLLTMLVAMPLRAISGYFTGQMATPAFGIVASVVALRRELSVKAEPYWTKSVARRFSLLFLGVLAFGGAGMLMSLVELTVLRQRLPALDSAAYYMVSRFSDISMFLSSALYVTLFPYTAERAECGLSTRPLVLKSSLAMIAFGALLALVFALFGRSLLALLPYGSDYASFAWAIPWLIGIMTLYAIQNFHTNTEISAGRFGFLKWWIPVNLVFALGLLAVTGYGHFEAYLPASWCAFLRVHNISSLQSMLWWMSAQALAKVLFSALEIARQK